MYCERTTTPIDVDIPALRERYRVERDKRLRGEGHSQYIDSDDFTASHEIDPHLPVEPRAPLDEDLDVAILGAGFSGILAGVQLRKAGVGNFRHIDQAGDFGGVWYWNRYPGIQCDNDAYCYLPLLEETGYMPTRKFVDGSEIHDHCRRIGEQFDLYEGALFHTIVKSLTWDEGIQRWRIGTNRGDDIRARFVVMCGGPLNKPKLPGIPGIADFKGRMFHTARWDYDYTGGDARNPVLDRLADKTVAIVGTGATAIQATPYLGRHARQLYVLQRTPSTVDERTNPATDADWAASLGPGWQHERQANFHRAAMERFLPGEPDAICDIWTEISRNLAAQLAERGWPEIDIADYMAMRDTEDYRVMERLRGRVDSIVTDPEAAEILKPWYRFLCKRPCSNNDFYPTFNKPNVKLIDVSETRGIEAMTAAGFLHDGVEYPIDCIIFASGFEASADLRRRWGIGAIDGRGGMSLFDHWKGGFETLHGIATHGFPNLFFTGYIQGGLNATTTEQFGRQGFHIAYIVGEALRRGVAVVEPTQAAQDAYVARVREIAVDISAFQQECTPSYFNDEGAKKPRAFFGEPWGHGWASFEQMLADWRAAGDLPGMALTRAETNVAQPA